MLGTSPSHPSSTLVLKNQSRLDWGQVVSRQINFLYVAGSIAFLSLGAWSAPHLRGWQRLWCVLGALLCELALVQSIKLVCYLPRPNATDAFCWGRRPHSGFPSGHTVPAFLLATMVTALHPLCGPFWYACATLIAWARWRTEAHYAYQVALSALIGVILAKAILYWV